MAPIHSRCISVLALLPSALAAVPYSEYILAPASRTLTPVRIHAANGSVTSPSALIEGGSGTTTLSGNSAITCDYGKDIGGLVSFTVNAVNGSGNYIGVSFSESSLWISPDGSDATQNVGIDETLWLAVNGSGEYAVENLHQRGGFRYLNLLHNSSGSVELTSVTTNFTAMPHYADDAMRDYTGYFHSDSEKLNRVWYASAYTNQLCTIPSTSGNSLVDLTATNSTTTTYWWSNSTLTNGSSALVDGAKRDKLIWPGDFSISLPAVFLCTNDQETLRLSVAQLFAQQNASTGQLRYVALPIHEDPPSSFSQDVKDTYSFTYHLYNLLALNNYYIYSGDLPFLQENWSRFVFGLNYSLQSIDHTGLAYVADNATADWLRVGMGARNIEANSILAYTLSIAQDLAHALNDTSLVPAWQTYHTNIATAANDLLWDEPAGLYKDNETTTLHPQDGNVWAILSGVANPSRAAKISESLKARWGPCGAPAPEAGTTVSPFISGLELQAHFLAGNPDHAIALIESMWSDFMLDDPRMTNSTFVEGYDTSGALHYPAYTDDARISHAHGWSTGPLLALTNFAAGLHVLNSSAWRIEPQPGGLGEVEAGFRTAVGAFGARYRRGVEYAFWTPEGTVGTVVMEGVQGGLLRSADGRVVSLVGGMAVGVPGGNWSLVGNGTGVGNASGVGNVSGGVPAYTGAAAVSLLLAVAGMCFAVLL